MLAMPIMQWGSTQPSLIGWAILGVLLQASLAILFLAEVTGTRRTTGIVMTVVAVAWSAEMIGSKTGIPFGGYHYTSILQPQVVGVPLLVPLAWLMMLFPAWAVAQRLTGRTSGLAFVAVSAAAFTAWDLYLDPQMVRWGLWVWDQRGPYFGIPVVNFAGWLLVSAAVTVLARPPALPQRPLLVIYTLTWLVEAVGLLLSGGLHGPALCGFIGMGLFTGLAWRNEVISRRPLLEE
jgi:putative membrane protein